MISTSKVIYLLLGMGHLVCLFDKPCNMCSAYSTTKVKNSSWNQPSEMRLGLEISLKDSLLEFSDSCQVRVNLHNQGDEAYDVPAIMEPEDYWLKFEIKDRHGNIIKFTGPELKIRYLDKKVSLLPQYYLGRVFDIGKLYRFPQPGTYTVRAVYGIPPTPRDIRIGPIRSNIITLTIRSSKK